MPERTIPYAPNYHNGYTHRIALDQLISMFISQGASPAQARQRAEREFAEAGSVPRFEFEGEVPTTTATTRDDYEWDRGVHDDTDSGSRARARAPAPACGGYYSSPSGSRERGGDMYGGRYGGMERGEDYGERYVKDTTDRIQRLTNILGGRSGSFGGSSLGGSLLGRSPGDDYRSSGYSSSGYGSSSYSRPSYSSESSYSSGPSYSSSGPSYFESSLYSSQPSNSGSSNSRSLSSAEDEIKAQFERMRRFGF